MYMHAHRSAEILRDRVFEAAAVMVIASHDLQIGPDGDIDRCVIARGCACSAIYIVVLGASPCMPPNSLFVFVCILAQG